MEDITVEVLSTTGQVLFTERFTAIKNAQKEILFSTLSPGFYICKITTGGGVTKSLKIVKE
jgi:Secretion system C-terminal sorting domain